MLVLASIAVSLSPAVHGLRAQEPDEDFSRPRSIEERLAGHPYFSRIALERVESHPPYLFLIQKTAGQDPARCAALAERTALRLDPALELFERELATPLGLTQRADHPQLLVALLASPGDLENYQRVTQAPWHLDSLELYDHALDAAVLYEDPFQAPRSASDVARSARHVFLHVCQQAWYAGGKSSPFASWVMEALACELACRDPLVPFAPTNTGSVREFLLQVQDERLRWAHARTIEELCTVAEPGRLDSFFRLRDGEDRPVPEDRSAAWWAFYRQSALLLHFLWEGDDGRFRSGLFAFLKQAFAGRADWPSFAASYRPTTAREIESAFLAWSLRVQQASGPRDKIDPSLVARALDRNADPVAPLEPPAPAAAPPLDLGDATADEGLAMAIDELAHGRAAIGLRALELIAHVTLEAAPRERAERERRRAAAWIELRDAHLHSLVASGALLELTREGRKSKSRVLGYEGGQLRLEKASELLSADAIDVLELAQQIRPSGGANDWVRLYPYVLRADPRWKKLLKDDGGEAGALLRDAVEDYPARLRLGAVARRLQEIAAREVPSTPSGVRTQLAELAEWRVDAEGLELLERKLPAVREHARGLLERQIELVGPHALSRGKLEALSGENVRLTYEFDDPRELEDFTAEPYPVLAGKGLGTEQAEDAPFHAEEGRLTCLGRTSLRSLIDFAAPMSVRYSLEFEHRELPKPNFTFALGICDDGHERFLWAVSVQFLQRYDGKNSDFGEGEAEQVFMNTPYAMELRHDGQRVALLCEEKELRSLTAGTRLAGAVFLSASTDLPIHVERLVIEGRLLPNAFERLQQAWIARELATY